MKIKKAARTVIFDEDFNTPIIIVRGGEYYKIPGGGIEEGESEIEAAEREAREEAGCEVEIIQIIGEHEFTDSNQTAHPSICFLAKKIGNNELPNFDDWEQSNNFELKWMRPDEAVKLFQSVNPVDEFGREINKRDLEFLQTGIKLYKK